jgi:hypothetical protein
MRTGLSSFEPPIDEQWTDPIIQGFLQVLPASEVVLRGQNRGMAGQKLNLLEFASVHMAKLRAAMPKVVRGDVLEFKPAAQSRTTYQSTFSEIPRLTVLGRWRSRARLRSSCVTPRGTSSRCNWIQFRYLYLRQGARASDYSATLSDPRQSPGS